MKINRIQCLNAVFETWGIFLHPDTAQTAKIKEDELVYSEAQDDKPKPVPASKFVAYFKSKAINGAAVLRKEFKASPNYACHLISNHLLEIRVSQTLAKPGYNSVIQVKPRRPRLGSG